MFVFLCVQNSKNLQSAWCKKNNVFSSEEYITIKISAVDKLMKSINDKYDIKLFEEKIHIEMINNNEVILYSNQLKYIGNWLNQRGVSTCSGYASTVIIPANGVKQSYLHIHCNSDFSVVMVKEAMKMLDQVVTR